jgi:ankyrin repeat protein
MLQILLDAGIDSTSALKMAIRYDRTDIVSHILKYSMPNNVNAEDGDILVQASQRGHLEMMKLLLKAGADPLACRGECIKLACRQGILSSLVH